MKERFSPSPAPANDNASAEREERWIYEGMAFEADAAALEAELVRRLQRRLGRPRSDET